jgi:hypothetical protein
MDDPHAGGAVATADVCFHEVKDVRRGAGAGAIGDGRQEPRRLVENDNVLILVDDAKVAGNEDLTRRLRV